MSAGGGLCDGAWGAQAIRLVESVSVIVLVLVFQVC